MWINYSSRSTHLRNCGKVNLLISVSGMYFKRINFAWSICVCAHFNRMSPQSCCGQMLHVLCCSMKHHLPFSVWECEVVVFLLNVCWAGISQSISYFTDFNKYRAVLCSEKEKCGSSFLWHTMESFSKLFSAVFSAVNVVFRWVFSLLFHKSLKGGGGIKVLHSYVAMSLGQLLISAHWLSLGKSHIHQRILLPVSLGAFWSLNG